jgi:hypothetical protein
MFGEIDDSLSPVACQRPNAARGSSFAFSSMFFRFAGRSLPARLILRDRYGSVPLEILHFVLVLLGASRVSNVPRLRRLCVLGSTLRE